MAELMADSEYITTWHKGKSYGRGELAQSLLREIVGTNDPSHGYLYINTDWLKSVAALADGPENTLTAIRDISG